MRRPYTPGALAGGLEAVGYFRGVLLPTRAFRYCEAFTSASAFGWYVFPPISFSLHWDGEDIAWSYDGAEAWYPLGRAQFPDFGAGIF